MSEHTTVYDLGRIDLSRQPAPAAGTRGAAAVASHPTSPMRAAASRSVRQPASGVDLPATLSIFVPGAGQAARGHVAVGLFFFTQFAFMATLAWALVDSLERVVNTLRLFGYPGAPGVWAICGVFGFAALLHLANVIGAAEEGGLRAPYPLAAGLASALVPGWGQVLNGAPRRAALFIGGLWIVAAAWILSDASVLLRLDELGLYLPDALHAATSAAVRWTAAAVLWALAIYDAAATAASRR